MWWGSQVECVSALARLERDGALDPQAAVLAFDRLKQLAAGWHEVDPSDIVREVAARFLRVHPLRAADALQLAAAFIAAEQRPASLEMITLDALRRRKGLPWSISPRTEGGPARRLSPSSLVIVITRHLRRHP